MSHNSDFISHFEENCIYFYLVAETSFFLRRHLKKNVFHCWSAFKRERALGKWSVMLLFARAWTLTAAAAGLPQCCTTVIIQEHGKAFLSCTQTGARGELKFPGSTRCLTDRSDPPRNLMTANMALRTHRKGCMTRSPITIPVAARIMFAVCIMAHRTKGAQCSDGHLYPRWQVAEVKPA